MKRDSSAVSVRTQLGSSNRDNSPRRHSSKSRQAHQVLDAVIERLELRQMLSGTAQVFKPGFVRWHPVSSSPAGNIKPLVSASPSGVTPAFMRKAYGLDSITFGSVTGDGTGQTIAIVDAFSEPTIKNDLIAFDTQFGLAAPPTFTVVNQTGGTSLPAADAAGGWGIETALDVEWAHVMAPKASILLVSANSANDADLYAAVDTARNYAGVSAVSMSWGGDETSADSANDSHFTTPSGHQGVTFLSSSGDNGAYSDTGSTTKIVGYPAASKNVVAIGGTKLTTSSGTYVSESGWGNGTNSNASGGSGGGISLYAAQPSYQTGIVTQSTTKRTLPDVSLDADPASGVPVYSAYDNGTSTPWDTYGGTSLSSPMWAGIIAVTNQDRVLNGLTTLDGATQTLPKLYSIPSTDYHDITTGNNGYAAAAGYDLVTGRGSPITTLLIPDLAGVPTAPTPAIGSLTVNPTSVVAGSNTPITLTASNVTETGGTISGLTFYRETNSVTGLQTTGTSDTLVGSGVQSGTTWTLSGVSTTGLTAATYTYYALASDTTHGTSATATSTLAVSSTSGTTGAVLSWNVGSLTGGANNFGVSPLAPTVVAAGLTNSVGLTRGSGLTTSGTAAAGGWGGTNWNSSSAGGISGNQFVTFGTTVATGYTLSLSALDLNYRRSGSGAATGLFQYQLNGGSWNDIASGIAFSSTSSSGAAIGEINLGTISGLQNIAAGTVANFRIVPYGSTGTGGTWYVYHVGTTGNDLLLNGTVAPAVAKTPLVLTGPVNYLELDADGTHLDVWNDTTDTGTIAQQVLLSQTSTISYTGTSGDDTLFVDFSDGNPLVATGISFDGGSGGNNALTLVGTTGGDSFTVNANSVSLATTFGSTFATVPINFSNTTSLSIDAGAGADTVTQSQQPNTALVFADPTDEDVVNVEAGTFTLPAVAGNTGVSAIALDTLHIEAGSKVVVASAASHDLRSVLVLGTLEDAGTLDLTDNDLLLHQGGYSNILASVKLGANYAAGYWNGAGITSSAAAGNVNHQTALAIASNDLGAGATLFGDGTTSPLFDGQTAVATDVIIKYTYYGDTNLSGNVDGSDYSRIDNGFQLHLAGWVNGDLNYDALVNGSDYTLMDNIYNTQGATLSPTFSSSLIHPLTFSNWSQIQPAIAKVPTTAGQLSNVSVVNFGSTVYTGPLNVKNTLDRIRADKGPDRTDDGIVYTNPGASGLPSNGTYYEFTVEVSGGTDHTFSGVATPGPMRILLATGGDCFFTGDHYVTFVPVYIVGQNTPTISTFSVNPTSVTAGAAVSLSAGGVSETGGTISSVKFYRETNNTTGLQTASDTLVGSGTQSGTTWSLANVSTTGFSAGTYTYYAVATDTGGFTSTTSVTSLTVTGGVTTTGAVLSWNVGGQNGFGSQGLAASSVAAGVTNSLGLTRGNGVSTTGTSASGAWGGSNWSTTTSASGISSSQFLSFGLSVATGFKFSAASVDLSYRRSTSGPVNGLWQYELNNGSWVTMADVANEFSSTTTSGTAMTELNLASVTALQNLAAGTSVQFRLVPYASKTTGGTFYIYDLPGNDLSVNGSITTA